MENPGNCTQTIDYVIRNGRDVLPTEIPKTLVHATNPSGIQPDLEVPTGLADPDRLTATPVTSYIPLTEDPITEIVPESLTTNIPDLRKRNDISPSPVRTFAEAADALLPTPLPLVHRAYGSAPDEWSCMWEVNVTLPDSAPRMFDVIFGNATVDEIPLGTRRVSKGELGDLGEDGNALGAGIQNNLTA